MKTHSLYTLILLLVACSGKPKPGKATILHIRDPAFKAEVTLQKLNTLPGYKLSVQNNRQQSSLHIPHPIFRFQLADVNRDGQTDILLGIIKKTHFEPVLEKRLQILRIDSGKLRPLWLGSKVCQKLIDFKPININGQCRIQTTEQDHHGSTFQRVYEWQNFGLRLVETSTAQKIEKR